MAGRPSEVPPEEERRARYLAARQAARDRLDATAFSDPELAPVDELTLRDWRRHLDWDAALAIVRRRYVP